jgi:Zn-dependent M28 family amino/carboxypeptidase
MEENMEVRRVAFVRLALPVLFLISGCTAGAEQDSVPGESTVRPAAFTEDAIDAARRFAQPSNDLRLAVLEEELRQRELPYTLQSFRAGGADEGRSDGHNVVVSLGDGPPRVIVGGHFDADRLDDGALSQGLVDNGAGVLVLLRAAETLRDAALRGTMHVVFFDMEELGLLGSRAYAEALDSAAGAVMVNVDIVGYGDTLLYGPGQLSPEHPLMGHVHRACARHAVACVGTPRMPPSDDRSFERVGIPAVSLAMLPAEEAHRLWLVLNGGLSDALRSALVPPILQTIHTDRDTVDKLDPAALTRAARIVTDLALALDAAAP